MFYPQKQHNLRKGNILIVSVTYCTQEKNTAKFMGDKCCHKTMDSLQHFELLRQITWNISL